MQRLDEVTKRSLQLYEEAARNNALILSNSHVIPDDAYQKQYEKYHTRGCLGGVIGIILSSEQRIILVHRSKSLSGWALPGGMVEHDEKFSEAFQREIFEEVGVHVTNVKLLMIEEKTFISSSTQDRYPFLLAVYIAQIEQDVLPPLTQEARREGLQVALLPLNDLPEDLILADRDKIGLFLENQRIT